MIRLLNIAMFMVMLCLSVGAQAANYQSFKAIPVLHEGRVKPLDSVARVYKERLSGSEYGASVFMAQVLFDPTAAADQPVIFIRDAQVLDQLGLAARQGHLYSLSELVPGLQKTEDQLPKLLENEACLTASQRTFVDVHEMALIYSRLLGTFSFMLPMAMELPDDVKVETAFEEGATYSELQPYIARLEERLQEVVQRKGEDFSAYSEQETLLAVLMFRLRSMESDLSRNDLFRIHADGQWISPWQLIDSTGASEDLPRWETLASAYRRGDIQAFEQAAQSLSVPQFKSAVHLETLYKAVKPFRLASVLYFMTLVLCMVYFIKPLKTLFALASVSAVFGAFVQVSGILARIIILDRPPVGSLYESLLFVGFIVVLCALIILCFRRQVALLLGGVSAALGILLIAPYIAPDGDNLETLVAVLNTNFWLATHVICITVGYGVCILSAMLSHIYLFRRGQGDRAEGLWSLLYIIAMVALFFTAFGTMLGGIWADQSWGRFWGWDPKENGALIIVLWIVWLVHARLGNHLSRLWLAAGFAMLNVIVALAWFGVNLLNVGLHSYGFISGIATGLTVFCVSEFVIIGLLLLRAQGKKREA